MKRILSLVLVAVLAIGAIALVGCNGAQNNKTVKLGLGVYVTTKATSATKDADGQGQVTITAAVVTVDENGKITGCKLDTSDNTVMYTNDGKAISGGEFKTKYEQGDAYKMVANGGAKLEWYKQADAFAGLVVGKTLSEVKALVAEGNKGNSDVIAAGCTIKVNDFVLAIEKAYNNAKDSAATAADALKLGVNTAQTVKDVNKDANGQNKLETTFFASAVDKNGKIVAATVDVVEVTFTFDANGASTYDATKAVMSKREQGDNYNMVANGGAKLEWYKQADVFAAQCVGKTAGDVEALMGSDNYGTADVKGAGCTILVNGFVKAAAKTK